MTFLGVKPFESEHSSPQYHCYLSESDNIAANAHVESFRTVWTRNDDDENVDPPAPFWIDAYIIPSDELVSVTVNAGDTGVSIGMKSTTSQNVADFRWLKDNARNYAISGQDTWVISGQVEVDDAGVYECHIQGYRSDAKQGLKLLIVRACPANRWGPDACDGYVTTVITEAFVMRTVENAFVLLGSKEQIVKKVTIFSMICCWETCGPNRFGETCDKECSTTGIECDRYLFCLAHPYGCSCNTGFKACDSGTYGASCLQTCHCQSGQCDRYTGVCTGSPPGCSSGWTGLIAKFMVHDLVCEGFNLSIVLDVCTTDYYGSTCTDKCHCMGNVACDKITGECPNQHCAPGYEVHMGEQNCAECLGPRFGESCADDCHCSESNCNKVTGSCSGGCNPEWVELFSPNLCQTGIIDAAYTRKNPGVTVPVTCTAANGPSPSDINQLEFVLSRHHENLDDNGISTGEITGDATTTTAAFMVDNVTDGQTLYCQLRKDGKNYAVYNITIDVFDLPVLQTAPEADSITDSTVTISWSAWDEENEDGDPPVIGYTPYYKLASGLTWSIQASSAPIKTLNFTFTALT
ncbi:putative angiopoietin-1 receptor [Apostichopus japonicus]|uniref:Putative angiopoietin-1 receptor n=1 Tax=Stichopus japonicus TaxID=307972 RepID=A0A2G8LG85_STIJA|nr:putative angiopoietin-1 receptor [Apostichopus japonicus]